MLIAGEWQLGHDGEIRPILLIRVIGAGGKPFHEAFLIDSGADCTAFTAALLNRLNLPTHDPPPDLALTGIGGGSRYVLVKTRLEFLLDDGGTGRFHGEFAAFTDPASADLSILGCDVLSHFDVILSRRRNEVMLLGAEHRYTISSGP
jgi:hypothetical protein